MLVPSLYGEESATRKTQSSSRRVWDEASLFESLGEMCPDGVNIIRPLYDAAVARDNYFYWGDGASPSVTAYLTVAGVQAPVWSCYTRPGTSSWDVNFDWMRSRGVPEEAMERLLKRLGDIPGVEARLQGVREAGWRKRPSIPISPLLAAPGAAEAVASAMEELVGPPDVPS